MPLRWTALASGSGGNASLLEADGFGLLIDMGLGPRQLAGRLATIGSSWRHVHGVLLTHTHGDHWNKRTLAQLHANRIPLYCHEQHLPRLRDCPREWSGMQRLKLVRMYEENREFALPGGVRCRPLPVRHDGGATFGFRIEGPGNLFSSTWAMAYVADLGCWDAPLAAALADVDLLALEFNHDVTLQRASGRSAALMGRVLGDEGHLSNDQAGELLRDVLSRSAPGRLQYLVQLHLSRDCNRPEVSVAAARTILAAMSATTSVHAAAQDRAGPVLQLGLVRQKATAGEAVA